jgi:hypothetical protein
MLPHRSQIKILLSDAEASGYKLGIGSHFIPNLTIFQAFHCLRNS